LVAHWLKIEMTQEHPLANPQAGLMNLLGFAEADLEANRDGYITKRQRTWLHSIQRQRVILIVLAIVTESVLIVVVTSGQSLSSCAQCSNPILALTIFMVAIAVFIVYFWLEWRKTKKDLYKGDVAVAEGIAHYRRTVTVGGRHSMYRTLFINQTPFRILRWKLPAFEYGELYRVHYAPRSNIILSAEWLMGDVSKPKRH
jgi:hypothetical protein